MTTASQTTGTPAPVKSVWKKVNETKDLNTPSPLHTLVNGSSADEGHDRESISSKDIAHGEGSSQGHSTPPSSMTDEATQIGSPKQPPTTALNYRPAPLPSVNPWKVRQEEAERKRWKDSQEVPMVPIQVDRTVPKSAPQLPQPKFTNKLNGVGKQEGKKLSLANVVNVSVGKPSRQKGKVANAPPPALEDAEAWPSPEAAAVVEKEERKQSTLIPIYKEDRTKSSPNSTELKEFKDVGKEEPREPKEPREGKKKKWEKLEVNFHYDSPQSRRGRGGKYNNRHTRGSTRDASNRSKEGEKEESRPRYVQRSDGEEPNPQNTGDPGNSERRAQSLNFDPGHSRSAELPPQEWQLTSFRHDSVPAPPPITHEPVPMKPEFAQQGPSSSLTPHQEQQTETAPSRSGQRSRSPKAPHNDVSTNGTQSDPSELQQSPMASPTQPPNRDGSQWEDEQNYSFPTSQAIQQGTQPPRRGNGRRFSSRNSFSPNAFPQGYMPPPPQPPIPFPGPFYPMYTPPMQPVFGPPGRSHSVPYFPPPANSSLPRYPSHPYQPQFTADFSRLGVQPAAVSIDEDTKNKIIRQVYVPSQIATFLRPGLLANVLREYWFSEQNLYKDTFLRKKMDGQGFVPLSELVQFARLRTITSDAYVVLAALLSSTETEVLSQSERGPLVRARHDWAKWVFPENEREESARHPGPADFWYSTHLHWYRAASEAYQQQFQPQQYLFDQQFTFPPTPFRPPQEHELSPPIATEEPQLLPQSLHFDPQNRKLSGEAKSFVPNGAHHQPPMVNGHDGGAFDMHSVHNLIPPVSEEPEEEPVDAVDEDTLRSLLIAVPEPKDRPIIPALPMNGAKAKSDRDLDLSRSPTQPITWRFSDVRAATQSSIPSITSGLSSLTIAQDEIPAPKPRPVETSLTETKLKQRTGQSGVTELTYKDFESKALESRQKSARDSISMLRLYQFWSDFLCDYWVPSMYTSFVKYAVEDANKMRRTGLLRLFSFYERALTVRFRMSLWNDFTRLAGEDYRNGHLAGIESVWRIRPTTRAKKVVIQDGDVSRLVDDEIRHSSDFEQLRREVKPAEIVLVPYTIVRASYILKPTNMML